MKKPLSGYNIVFYKLSVWFRCAARCVRRRWSGQRFAKERRTGKLPFRVYKHQSVLVRKLGDTDLQLQYNKVINIRLAIQKLNGLIIQPGESFSFYHLVGKATKRKGFLEGMLLSDGEAKRGIGGGLCQIANLIHWLCLHSPLTVTERHHHSFDPFPDQGRVVPFGSGASIFYNYMDYQFCNDTPHTFQLLFWLDEKCLNGDLRTDENLPYVFHIEEREHEFVRFGDVYYRKNELWQHKTKKIGSGERIAAVCIQRNLALVKYLPASYRVLDAEGFAQLKLWAHGEPKTNSDCCL